MGLNHVVYTYVASEMFVPVSVKADKEVTSSAVPIPGKEKGDKSAQD
jgi:hypothetical protein